MKIKKLFKLWLNDLLRMINWGSNRNVKKEILHKLFTNWKNYNCRYSLGNTWRCYQHEDAYIYGKRTKGLPINYLAITSVCNITMHSFSESIHSDLSKLWHYRYNLGPWEKSHFNIQNKEKHINKYFSRYLQG